MLLQKEQLRAARHSLQCLKGHSQWAAVPCPAPQPWSARTCSKRLRHPAVEHHSSNSSYCPSLRPLLKSCALAESRGLGKFCILIRRNKSESKDGRAKSQLRRSVLVVDWTNSRMTSSLDQYKRRHAHDRSRGHCNDAYYQVAGPGVHSDCRWAVDDERNRCLG